MNIGMNMKGDNRYISRVHLLKQGDEKQIVTTYNNNIERTGYSNGIDPILFSRLNLCDLNFELDGERKRYSINLYINGFSV